MVYAEKRNSIQIEFVCKDCQEDRHGCAGIWKGLGLEISCDCNCEKAASSSSPSIVKNRAHRERRANDVE
jgi:hypothetical protein